MSLKFAYTVKKLTNCARCGGTHSEITFFQLDIPSGEYTHYTFCPTNLQPILLAFTND
jgi:hypothetical protein